MDEAIKAAIAETNKIKSFEAIRRHLHRYMKRKAAVNTGAVGETETETET